jgi:hypothetical protein
MTALMGNPHKRMMAESCLKKRRERADFFTSPSRLGRNELSWWRWAGNNEFRIHSIAEDSPFTPWQAQFAEAKVDQ